MKTQILLLFLIISNFAFSQSDSISKRHFTIPKNINCCISEFDKVFTSKAKAKLQSLKVDTLCYVSDVFIIDEWLQPDSSRLKTYFKNQGLQNDYEMEYFILLSYYKYLQTGKGDISSELKCYNDHNNAIKQAKQRECDSLRMLDTIDKQYIPKNILDCYHQLDRILSDSIKSEIKTSPNLFGYHFSLGRWIRNNMGLWSCSRFKDYFQEHKIKHPDDMSGIIIEGYKLYLNGTSCEINDLISKITPPPPISATIKTKVKFEASFKKKEKRFVKKRRIDDFEISEFTIMKIKNCIEYI
jgi:hypothetical protein